jgi:mannosyltransferase OCH1-like enzyme
MVARKRARTYTGYFLLILFIAFLVFLFVQVNSLTPPPADENSLQEIPFHVKATKISESTATPLILYHSWHSNSVPTKMAENIYALIKSNPEFDYYLYSDEKSEDYIRDNYDQDVMTAFKMLKPGAYKCDLWRYCVLYKTGGVYMDIKFNTVEPLLQLIQNTPTIFVKDRDRFGDLKCVYNGVMASPPRNEIFKQCIDEIVRNCKVKLYNTNPLDVTGPCLLGRMLSKYQPDTLKNTPYSFDTETSIIQRYFPSKKEDLIKYKDKIVMKSYPEYRTEQKQFQKTEGYDKLWTEKNIYN